MDFCPLEIGEYAWRPNKEIVEDFYDIWHYYDVPLIGKFKVGLRWFIFEYTEGPYDEEQEWHYWPVTKEELDTMPESFSTPEDFDQWLGEICMDKELWVGETESYKLVKWREESNHL